MSLPSPLPEIVPASAFDVERLLTILAEDVRMLQGNGPALIDEAGTLLVVAEHVRAIRNDLTR